MHTCITRFKCVVSYFTAMALTSKLEKWWFFSECWNQIYIAKLYEDSKQNLLCYSKHTDEMFRWQNHSWLLINTFNDNDNKKSTMDDKCSALKHSGPSDAYVLKKLCYYWLS